jgi:hypothetical protein
LRPSSGFEARDRWLSSNRGDLLVSKELTPWASAERSWESGSCSLGLGRMGGAGVRGLVLPPEGALLSGNLDNAKCLET